MERLSSQAYPLPEAILKALDAGYTTFALSLIDAWLERDDIPAFLRERLQLEKVLAKRRLSHYIYSYDEAEALLATRFAKYRKGMLDSFIAQGLLDWAYVDGQLRLEERLIDNAAKRCPVLKEEEGEDPDLRKRDDFVALLKERGRLTADITTRLTFTITDSSLAGRLARVNLPIPKAVEGRQEVVSLDFSPAVLSVDGEDAPMRTVLFEKRLTGCDEFTMTAHYRLTECRRPFPQEEYVAPGMEAYLKEEAPHIIFTPALKSLAHEITAGCTGMRAKAEAIYDWITSHILYSFVRPYSTIDCISEYAASSLKGDCGIQAMLFITLCRIAGVPAAWESGWYVTDCEAGSHDWARINISGQWFPVDCSFGGGAFRQGKEERRRHYFGQLDCMRMIVNSTTGAILTGKTAYPRDPTDNQRGEAEVDGQTLLEGFDVKPEVLSYSLS